MHETSIPKIGRVPCNKASSRAKPSQVLFINTRRRLCLLEDKGCALFYQQYTLLFYQVADDMVWWCILFEWYRMALMMYAYLYWDEAEPSQASSPNRAKPSDCTRTASNKPNQHLLDDVLRGEICFGICWMVCCGCTMYNGQAWWTERTGVSQAKSTWNPTIQQDKLLQSTVETSNKDGYYFFFLFLSLRN